MVKEDEIDDLGTFVRSELGLPDRQRRTVGYFAGRNLVLHAMASSAGYECVTSSDYNWNGLRRGSAEFVLLQYTIAGRGQLIWKGESYTIGPGQAMFLHFPDDNHYWLAEGDTWEHCYCCLHGREVLRAWRTMTMTLGPIVRIMPGNSLLKAHLSMCRSLLEAQADPFSISAQAYALAMHVLALCGTRPDRDRHPGIEAAKTWGRQHAADNIDIADLARIAGLSRHHFSRSFTAQEGISAIAWLTDQRLRIATRMLRESDAGVSEIAARCGYSDPAYFCRVFRKTFGVSPGEFRSSGMY